MSNSYFKKELNYSLGNEDTAMEVGILEEDSPHVFSVSGSGGRVVPLLSRSPKKLTCVDISEQQLYLVELRIACIKALTVEQYAAFLGYPPSPLTPEERKKIFHSLTLSEKAKTYFEAFYEARQWEHFLYDGKWEKMFQTLSRINSKITGTKGRAIFECKTLEEQKKYYDKGFPHLRWLLVVSVLGNASVFDALLYKGDCAKKNIGESFVAFYRRVFAHLFTKALARENYFLQLCFFGKVVYPEGNPVECDPKVFAKAKEALKTCEVEYMRGDVIELAKQSKTPVSFYSLSDVPSYFMGEKEKNYLQDLKSALSPGATVVLRYYLHIPEGTDKTGYENQTDRYRELISSEKVGVYHVEILKFI